MQLVVRRNRFVGVQAEPAFRHRIPSDGQRLQAPARQLDQVLLQRLDAERVFDFKIGGLAIRAVGADKKFAVAPGENRRTASVFEAAIGEIAEDILFRRLLHGAGMLRAGPGFGRAGVATGASLAADEGRWHDGRSNHWRGGSLPRAPQRQGGSRGDGERGHRQNHGLTRERHGGGSVGLRRWRIGCFRRARFGSMLGHELSQAQRGRLFRSPRSLPAV